MTDVLKYKNYVAQIGFDAEDRVFFGRIAGIGDGVGFHSDTVEGLVAAFQESVDDYLDTCARIGKPPERPYSGNVYLRVDPALHARVALAAQLAGKSLSQFGREALERAVAQELSPR